MAALRSVNGLASWRHAENSLQSLNVTMPFGGERVARALGSIGGQGVIEAVQDGGQQALQNLIAREVYNPEQAIIEGVEHGAGIGGIVGGLAGMTREGILGDSNPPLPVVAGAPAPKRFISRKIKNRFPVVSTLCRGSISLWSGLYGGGVGKVLYW